MRRKNININKNAKNQTDFGGKLMTYVEDVVLCKRKQNNTKMWDAHCAFLHYQFGSVLLVQKVFLILTENLVWSSSLSQMRCWLGFLQQSSIVQNFKLIFFSFTLIFFQFFFLFYFCISCVENYNKMLLLYLLLLLLLLLSSFYVYLCWTVGCIVGGLLKYILGFICHWFKVLVTICLPCLVAIKWKSRL